MWGGGRECQAANGMQLIMRTESCHLLSLLESYLLAIFNVLYLSGRDKHTVAHTTKTTRQHSSRMNNFTYRTPQS